MSRKPEDIIVTIIGDDKETVRSLVSAFGTINPDVSWVSKQMTVEGEAPFTMTVYMHHAPTEMGPLPPDAVLPTTPRSSVESIQPSTSALRSSSIFRGVQVVVFAFNLAHLSEPAGVAALDHRMQQLEDSTPSKCKLVLCGLDFRPAVPVPSTPRAPRTSDTTFPCVGVGGKGDGSAWNDLKDILDSLDNQTCNMLRCFNIDDKTTVTEFFEDVYYVSKMPKKRPWKTSLPGLLKEPLPVFSEKINALLRHKSHASHYEELDKLIHETLADVHIKLNDIMLLFTIKKLDRKSFVYLFSHYPHVQDWGLIQHPTYQFMYQNNIVKSAFDWAQESVPQFSKVPPDVSMPFLLLSGVPVEQLFGAQITTLNLSHNRISQVPHNFFQETKCLKVLDLSWNKLIALSDTISKCLELTELNLEHNDLTSLPESLGDCLQMTLSCGHNKLSALPFTLAGHVRYHKLHYLPNPLENMRKCNSSEEMADYLDELALSGITRWNRVRLMIVGSENVGKTTLTKKFQGLTHNGISTDGIEITDLQIKDVTFTVWDLGGQSVFLPTHQFFLTGRALYLVLFNIQNPDTLRIEYWLRQIARTVKQPPSPPVILVGTHADLCTEDSARAACQSIFKFFRCIGSLVDCIPVSTLEGKIGDLQNCIIKTSISKQMVLRERVPGSWILLDKEITRKRLTSNTLHWNEFVELANQVQIEDESKIKQAAQFLHSVGSIIFYENSYSELGKLVVLNPQYLADLMCTMITFKTTMIINGFIARDCLLHIWGKYDVRDHNSLIDLLSLYLIIHPIALSDGREGFLVPCALPDDEPPDAAKIWPASPLDKFIQYERVFVFPCLPMGLFGRLLVRILHFHGIGRKAFWKNNIRLEVLTPFDARCQTLYIYFDCTSGNNPSLFVRVRAHQDIRPDVLTDTMECVDTTVECFYKSVQLELQRLITCNHCPLPLNPATPQPHQFTLDEVVESISSHKSLICKNENIPLRLDKLAPELTLGQKGQISRESLTNLTLIASGGFGKVYKGELSGQVVAVKELLFHEGDDPKEKFAEFRKEAMLMSALDNPYVVQLLGVCMSPPMMVMEFIPCGTLFDLLHKSANSQEDFIPPPFTTALDDYPNGEEAYNFPMNWRFRLLLALDITIGMYYLHTLKPPVVHRDLRSPNIFMLCFDPKAPVRAKVADFGLSVRAAGKVAGNLSTWQWLAPEVIDCHSEEYDEKSDIFSLGIVYYELVTRMYPYDEYAENPKYSRKKGTSVEWREQNIKIAISQEDLRPTIPDNCPKKLAKMMHNCWNRVPNLRPSAESLTSELEDMLELPHRPMEEKEEEPRVELPELPEVSSLWQVYDEAKSWCITENAGALWFSFADGTVRHLTKSKGSSLGPNLDLEHKTRIYSIIFVKDELWASSELGIVIVFDLQTMTKKEELPLHGFKQSIAQLLLVTAKDTIRVWSSCPTEYTIVSVDPSTREVVNRVTFDKTVNINFMVLCDCDDTVWVGCWNKVVILDALTMTTQRSITDIAARFSSCIYLNKRVWAASKAKILVFDCDKKNIVATLVGHDADITWLTPCESYMCSCDQEGSIIIWHPVNFTSVKTISLKGYFITRMFYFSRLLFYTFVHPKSGIGCYAFGEPPPFPEEDVKSAPVVAAVETPTRRRAPSAENITSCVKEDSGIRFRISPPTSPREHVKQPLPLSPEAQALLNGLTAPSLSYASLSSSPTSPSASSPSSLSQVRRAATFLSLRHGHSKSMSVSGPAAPPSNSLAPPPSTSSSLSPRNTDTPPEQTGTQSPKLSRSHISQLTPSQSSPSLSSSKSRNQTSVGGGSFLLLSRKKTPPPSDRKSDPSCATETHKDGDDRELNPVPAFVPPEAHGTPDTSPEPELKKEKRSRSHSKHEIDIIKTEHKDESTLDIHNPLSTSGKDMTGEHNRLEDARRKAEEIERAIGGSERRLSTGQVERVEGLQESFESRSPGQDVEGEFRPTGELRKSREERKKAREERKQRRDKEGGPPLNIPALNIPEMERESPRVTPRSTEDASSSERGSKTSGRRNSTASAKSEDMDPGALSDQDTSPTHEAFQKLRPSASSSVLLQGTTRNRSNSHSHSHSRTHSHSHVHAHVHSHSNTATITAATAHTNENKSHNFIPSTTDNDIPCAICSALMKAGTTILCCTACRMLICSEGTCADSGNDTPCRPLPADTKF
ncbi:leucinerich repeat kinase [Pelomyxa schiedti]|nr:leucinerich repeat kinase [Pelomyxa schiedti]